MADPIPLTGTYLPVIASGAHYSAVRRLLRENGCAMFMCGMFFARIP